MRHKRPPRPQQKARHRRYAASPTSGHQSSPHMRRCCQPSAPLLRSMITAPHQTPHRACRRSVGAGKSTNNSSVPILKAQNLRAVGNQQMNVRRYQSRNRARHPHVHLAAACSISCEHCYSHPRHSLLRRQARSSFRATCIHSTLTPFSYACNADQPRHQKRQRHRGHTMPSFWSRSNQRLMPIMYQYGVSPYGCHQMAD